MPIYVRGTPAMKAFRDFLQSHMTAHNLSKSDVTRLSGVDTAAMSRFFNSNIERGLSLESIVRVMKGLNIPFSELDRVFANVELIDLAD